MQFSRWLWERQMQMLGLFMINVAQSRQRELLNGGLVQRFKAVSGLAFVNEICGASPRRLLPYLTLSDSLAKKMAPLPMPRVPFFFFFFLSISCKTEENV